MCHLSTGARTHSTFVALRLGQVAGNARFVDGLRRWFLLGWRFESRWGRQFPPMRRRRPEAGDSRTQDGRGLPGLLEDVVRDLPAKHEMKVVCTLTREQASLYQAAVDEAMRRIKSAEGIQRRGLVLALITALKQICNHPAHYLGESGPLAGRSGKLQRLSENCSR